MVLVQELGDSECGGSAMKQTSVQPSYRSSRVRRWVAYLWREAIRESWRPVAPAFAKPNPAEWDDARMTAAWLGHATVLINFFGIKILTDPVLFPRIGFDCQDSPSVPND